MNNEKDTHTHFKTAIPGDHLDYWPVLSFAVISNVWIKMMTFRKKGDRFSGHSHLFDHGTLLSSGSLELEIDGIKTVFTAPAIIFVEKEKIHNLVALEDNTVAACIHALRDANQSDDILDPAMIPSGIGPGGVFRDSRLNLTPLVSDNKIIKFN